MHYKNSAILLQALLDGLIHLRSGTLCYPEDFSAFSDVAEEWYALEASLSGTILTCLKNLQNKDVE